MELTFASQELGDTANSSLMLSKRFGADAPFVRQRLFELAAAENLAVLAEIPTLCFALQPLGEFSVAAGSAHHIKFISAADAMSRGSKHRSKELHSITEIRILSIG